MSNELNLITGGTAWEGASRGRRLASWKASNSGPNNLISANLTVLRARCRDAARNSPIAAAALATFTRSLVGFGIRPRFKTPDLILKAKLTQLFEQWGETADTTGGDFASLQQLAVRGWMEGGEVFIRIRPRRIEDGLAVPMQLEVLESDMCPLLDADTYEGLPNGNTIRQGIEFNPIGRRVAYWLWKSHPGDKAIGVIEANQLSRIPADAVIHLFEPLRAGQIRGVPLLANVLARLRNVESYDDATLERQHLANMFTMFVTRPMPSGANDPMTGLAYQGSSDEPIAALEPGISQELLPGEDVKFSEPPDAGANYSEYMRTQLASIAAGLSIPYEILSGDLRDVSDRTLRAGIMEFRRGVEAKLWGCLIPRMFTPIRNAFSKFAQLGGALTEAEAAAAIDLEWCPPAWPMIHPLQDAQRAQLEVEAGFRSRSSVISEMGFDPTTVDIERAEERRRATELGSRTTTQAELDRISAGEDFSKIAAETISGIDTLIANLEKQAAAL